MLLSLVVPYELVGFLHDLKDGFDVVGHSWQELRKYEKSTT